jgi:hypothetical protein
VGRHVAGRRVLTVAGTLGVREAAATAPAAAPTPERRRLARPRSRHRPRPSPRRSRYPGRRRSGVGARRCNERQEGRRGKKDLGRRSTPPKFRMPARRHSRCDVPPPADQRAAAATDDLSRSFPRRGGSCK